MHLSLDGRLNQIKSHTKSGQGWARSVQNVRLEYWQVKLQGILIESGWTKHHVTELILAGRASSVQT